MPAMAPHHSVDPNDKKHVYHNNSACTEQNNIEKKFDKPGTGGYPLCEHCARLNSLGQ
jgi:hypothetical protein